MHQKSYVILLKHIITDTYKQPENILYIMLC